MKNIVLIFFASALIPCLSIQAQSETKSSGKWPYNQGAVNIWGGISGGTFYFKEKDLYSLWDKYTGMSPDAEYNILPVSIYATVKLWPRFISIGGFATRNWVGNGLTSEETVESTTYYWGYNGYYNSWNYYSSSTNTYYSGMYMKSTDFGGLIQIAFNDELRNNYKKLILCSGLQIGIGKTVAEGSFYFNSTLNEPSVKIKGESPFYSFSLYTGQYFPMKKSEHICIYIGTSVGVQFSKIDKVLNANTNSPLLDKDGQTIPWNFTGIQFLGIKTGFTFY